MKVLVIDDEEEVRIAARFGLELVAEMHVIEASGGEEGIARARSERPDLILLDVMMPGMDGTATFRALRADARTASIPIVFVTATETASTAEMLAADGILRKPFDPRTFARDVTGIAGMGRLMPDELRAEYRETARERVAEIEALLERIDGDVLPRLSRHFHAFAGMGSTYGFPRISTLGDELERSIGALLGRGELPDAATVERWRELVREIARELC